MLIEGHVTVRHDDSPLMALDIIEESMVIRLAFLLENITPWKKNHLSRMGCVVDMTLVVRPRQKPAQQPEMRCGQWWTSAPHIPFDDCCTFLLQVVAGYNKGPHPGSPIRRM